MESLGKSSRAFKLILLGMFLVAVINIAVGILSFPWGHAPPESVDSGVPITRYQPGLHIPAIREEIWLTDVKQLWQG